MARDPWLPRLAVGAVSLAALLLVLWGSYAVFLRRGIDRVGALVPSAVATAPTR